MDDSVPKSPEEATTEDEEDDTVEQTIAEESQDTVVDQEIVNDGITKMKKTFSFSDGTEYKPPKVKRRGKSVLILNYVKKNVNRTLFDLKIRNLKTGHMGIIYPIGDWGFLSQVKQSKRKNPQSTYGSTSHDTKVTLSMS